MLPFFFKENLAIFTGKFHALHRKIHNFSSKLKNQGIDKKISIPEKNIDTSPVTISGNELVDIATKEASNLTSHRLDPIPITDFLIKQKTFLAWEHHWQNLPTSNKLRARKSTVDYSSPPKTFTRRQEVKMCRFRFGRAALTHNYLLNKSS